MDYVRLPISGGTMLVDVNDWQIATERKLHVDDGGYARFSGGGGIFHRVLMAPPAGMVIDHINGDRLDNRRANLRICTVAENLRNGSCHKDSTSKYRGVSLKRGRWRAQICRDYKVHFLGTFNTEIEAAIAYDAAARRLHGEFAGTNFTPEGTTT